MPVLLQMPAKGCRWVGLGLSTLVRVCTTGSTPGERKPFDLPDTQVCTTENLRMAQIVKVCNTGSAPEYQAHKLLDLPDTQICMT